MAARLLEKPEDHAQAETGPSVAFLGGEEWVEDATDHFRRYAGPGIGHLARGVRARRHPGVGGGIVGVEVSNSGGDQKLSTSGHGITRVRREVGERRLDLRSIDENGTGAIGEIESDLDIFAEHAL